MVDSSDKGTRAEYAVRDLLRKQTGLGWERVPGSGGFSAVQGLKGDLHIPQTPSQKYCVEVKHYKDDVINCLLLKNMDSNLGKFWAQSIRQSAQINKEPLLVFRKDRGQWMLATREPSDILPEMAYTSEFRENIHAEADMDRIYIYLFSTWLATKTRDDFV